MQPGDLVYVVRDEDGTLIVDFGTLMRPEGGVLQKVMIQERREVYALGQLLPVLVNPEICAYAHHVFVTREEAEQDLADKLEHRLTMARERAKKASEKADELVQKAEAIEKQQKAMNQTLALQKRNSLRLNFKTLTELRKWHSRAWLEEIRAAVQDLIDDLGDDG